MNSIGEAITAVFGIVLVAAIALEIRQRRKRLRELYNVLDAEDRQLVADLDTLVANGILQPYAGG